MVCPRLRLACPGREWPVRLLAREEAGCFVLCAGPDRLLGPQRRRQAGRSGLGSSTVYAVPVGIGLPRCFCFAFVLVFSLILFPAIFRFLAWISARRTLDGDLVGPAVPVGPRQCLAAASLVAGAVRPLGRLQVGAPAEILLAREESGLCACLPGRRVARAF